MKIISLLIFTFLSLNRFSQSPYKGCFLRTSLAASGSITSKCKKIIMPFDSQLNNVTIREIWNIQNCLAVYPIFYFYDDKDGNNAMATDEVTAQNGPDGTIAFGKHLFNSEFIKTYGGTTIPIIMAHEYAHIVDYKYGALHNVGSKKTELFADYLAGFYMYHRVANGIPTDVPACLESFKSLGDTDFGSETHHGTPEERYAALFGGFSKAKEIHQKKPFIPLTEIIAHGKSYINGIEDPEEDVIIIK